MPRTTLLLAAACCTLTGIVTLRATTGAVRQDQNQAPLMPSTLSADELKAMFPEGPGRDATFRVCTKCHPPEKIATKHQIREDWEETINLMITRGAQVSDDDFSVVLDYLAEALPLQVNVNTAAAEEFESAFGLKHAEALAVVEYRKANGPFKTIDDFKKIPNIEYKRITLKKEAVKF